MDFSFWKHFVLSVSETVIAHSIEMPSTLVQLGYVPKALVGEKFTVPSALDYWDYIYGLEGLSGCTRGITSKAISAIIFHSTVALSRPLVESVEERSSTLKNNKYARIATRVTISYGLATLAANAFVVLSLRQVGQFVGKETVYSGVNSFFAVYQNNGILGYLSGAWPLMVYLIVPTMLADVTAAFLTDKFVDETALTVQNEQGVVGFHTRILNNNANIILIIRFMIKEIASHHLRPFCVASSNIMVNYSGIQVGNNELVKMYPTWVHCLWHMYTTGLIKRRIKFLNPTFPKNPDIYILY